MAKQLTKMPFWKLAYGKMAQDFQALFEKAQRIAIDRNLPCKVKLVVEVRPPDPKDPFYGNIRYETDLREPAMVSKQYQTLLHDGIIIDNPELGAPQLDLLIHSVKSDITDHEDVSLDPEKEEEEND